MSWRAKLEIAVGAARDVDPMRTGNLRIVALVLEAAEEAIREAKEGATASQDFERAGKLREAARLVERAREEIPA